MSGPIPVPTPETIPFWDAALQGRLVLPRCSPCASFFFYPRPFCPVCGSDEIEWVEVSGRARLTSYIINHRPLPPHEPGVPQVIALVTLEEGPRLMTNIVDANPDPEQLPLDMPLSVRFVPRGERALPVFAPAEGGA